MEKAIIKEFKACKRKEKKKKRAKRAIELVLHQTNSLKNC
jgi:hypothetical protein